MNDEIAALEERLNLIQTELDGFEKQGTFNDDVYLLCQEKQLLQRSLSMAKKQETAVLLDYPYPWDTGAPLPHVVSDGLKTFLIYYIGEHDPRWKAAGKTITDLQAGSDDVTALVTFTGCYNYKFGGANNEAIYGHPLYDHGLECYSAHEIINSNWLSEQEKINSVHPNYQHALWENYKHYIFTFHDEMFECIARDYKVDVFRGGISSVFAEATKRLFA